MSVSYLVITMMLNWCIVGIPFQEIKTTDSYIYIWKCQLYIFYQLI